MTGGLLVGVGVEGVCLMRFMMGGGWRCSWSHGDTATAR